VRYGRTITLPTLPYVKGGNDEEGHLIIDAIQLNMKKVFSFFLIALILSAGFVSAAAVTAAAKSAAWKPAAPSGYSPITWASSPGIASFFKAPEGNGSIDFLTRIYLPQNQIRPLISGTPSGNEPADSNFLPDFPAQVPTPEEAAEAERMRNYRFERVTAEAAKKMSSEIKFIWDAPFFNMGNGSNDLSLAFKYSRDGIRTVTSGSRSDADLKHARRMLLIDNSSGEAAVKPFDSVGFLDKRYDVGLEGFAPGVGKNDGATGRLFLGVSPDGREIVVYCSKQATPKEAMNALAAAGIPAKNQLEADGGGSAACGYNLPGQFFVEPTRTLPLLMGAATIVARGTITTEGTNVRKGPSTKNAIVKKMPKGKAVQAFEEKDGWYRIGDGEWVIKTLVKTAHIGR
jgi:hypothetical protein